MNVQPCPEKYGYFEYYRHKFFEKLKRKSTISRAEILLPLTLSKRRCKTAYFPA
jgi:hypothetical protein